MITRRAKMTTSGNSPTVYRLEFQAGRPVFTSDGKPIGSAAYCDSILRDKLEAIDLDITPPETRLFYLGAENPFNDRSPESRMDTVCPPITHGTGCQSPTSSCRLHKKDYNMACRTV